MTALSLETLTAYCRTSYRADTDSGSFVLRVGRRHPEFDGWLRSGGYDRWALLTAWNPRSTVLTPEQNAARHARLIARIDDLKLPRFPSQGLGDDPAWPPEEGLLIVGIDSRQALALAAEFEQHAIVAGRGGEPAELQFPFWEDAEEALARGLDSDDRVVEWTARRAFAENRSGQ
jgi:hypothetical protein